MPLKNIFCYKKIILFFVFLNLSGCAKHSLSVVKPLESYIRIPIPIRVWYKEENLSKAEYFSETEYCVKASPKAENSHKKEQKKKSFYKIGKPYQIKGHWYYPKEYKRYKEVGLASWYGSAFQGRLTANGEVYDMNHLSAAHRTMPLPSYARVTNLANGTSVIVRINDRGPYANDRIIDLSKRAAEMLDYKKHGLTKVKVEYIGKAPLHAKDEAYLLRSYRRR